MKGLGKPLVHANHYDWSPWPLHTWQYQVSQILEMSLMLHSTIWQFQWLFTACQSQKSFSTAHNNHLLHYSSKFQLILFPNHMPNTHFSQPGFNDLVPGPLLHERITDKIPVSSSSPSGPSRVIHTCVWALLDSINLLPMYAYIPNFCFHYSSPHNFHLTSPHFQPLKTCKKGTFLSLD